MVENVLSYANFLTERRRFKSASKFEDPATFYFKIMFYFDNKGEDNDLTSNLLGLNYVPAFNEGVTDMGIGSVAGWQAPVRGNMPGAQSGAKPVAYSVNTAYNYLMINGEEERAGYLKDFICLLSEISSETPWFFKSVEGLDTAVERTYFKEFKFEAEPRALTINCIQESIDTRITTLIELYRAACYSQRWKREIIPANLRKFDMGIYLFQGPINGLSYNNTDKDLKGYVPGKESQDDPNKYTNCKYFEFHNCEIDSEASIKTCYTTFDNSESTIIEPKIVINYDDCIVSNYNEDLCKTIGDLVELDILGHSDYKESANKLKENYTSKSLTDALLDNLADKAKNAVGTLVRKAYLGNVYGFSIRNAIGAAEQFASGDMIGGAMSAVKEVAKTTKSVITGKVVSDTIPSLVNKAKQAPHTIRNLGNIRRNL